jgi:hypothetical protein
MGHQEQLEGETACVAVEFNRQAVLIVLKAWAVPHDGGQREHKLVARTGKQGLGLARHDVGNFTHAVGKQIIVYNFAAVGENPIGERGCGGLRETENQSPDGRRSDWDQGVEGADRRPTCGLIHGVIADFGTGHFTKGGARGLDERLQEPVANLLGGGWSSVFFQIEIAQALFLSSLTS